MKIMSSLLGRLAHIALLSRNNADSLPNKWFCIINTIRMLTVMLVTRIQKNFTPIKTLPLSNLIQRCFLPISMMNVNWSLFVLNSKNYSIGSDQIGFKTITDLLKYENPEVSHLDYSRMMTIPGEWFLFTIRHKHEFLVFSFVDLKTKKKWKSII